MHSKFSVTILTIFPELFPGPLNCSIIGKALKGKLFSLNVVNIRDFTNDKHRSVDTPPIGGGGGMLMRADVLGNAIDYSISNLDTDSYSLIYLSPRGQVFNQQKAYNLLEKKNIILICGRFEGIDQRIIDHYNIEEISIGDYILTGGEIASYAILDTCVRLIPGVLGNELSLQSESFGSDKNFKNLVEYPQYTKPNCWKNHTVPEIMLSGNHTKINHWRLEQAKKVTQKLRPDLWEKYIKQSNN